jgi:3-methyladenine DNA glycosylase Mpg
MEDWNEFYVKTRERTQGNKSLHYQKAHILIVLTKQGGIFNMSRITDRDFFTQSAVLLAESLLGKIICRTDRDDKGEFIIKYRITETEAYADDDEACDGADSQKLEGGHIYVTKKGMHGWGSRFDIVASTTGKAESVLISGIDCYKTLSMITDALDIDEKLDGEDLLSSNEIWIEDDGVTAESAPPIGRQLSGKRDIATKSKPYRFIAKRFTFTL